MASYHHPTEEKLKTGKPENEKAGSEYLAPEVRHVYSTRNTQITQAPAGRHVLE